MRFTISIFIIFIILAGCSGGGKETAKEDDGLNRRDRLRLKQYKIQGRKLYTQYCANCHQMNGEGLGELFPPLAESDYLMEDIPRAICTVKNGLKGEIIVNGTAYNQPMVGIDLNNLEIAEIITYITNDWGNETGEIVSQNTVAEVLSKCE